ncbi:ABC-2 type transport system permease protein [Clostridium acidisoli DSM 12555]|uniref:Transport permease protein n=1 Tax=Clostridium acidisoli DSM 12555 TaxID=1121291 RepID=A0A1W1XE10_9CLOT|nr:ABC transporter permease [Clostridium acidisoli]SMC22110.1 ABC-2 type transport system permease protein [Clostridium acidisoli DSM 12555]
MNGFIKLMVYGLQRRMKDFFIIIYSVIFPIVEILLLGYLATNFFKGDSSITSNHYYTLVLIPFYLLTSIITVAFVAKDESLCKTSYRFIIAPIDNAAIVLSKVLSCTIVIWICSIIILLITRVLLGINFGSNTPIILLMFFTETLMASAIGIYLGICIKNFGTIKGILNIPLSIFGLLGGSFFPVGSLGDKFEKITYISPFTWINRGLISVVYDNNDKILIYSIGVTLIIAIMFSVLSIISFKKEAFL